MTAPRRKSPLEYRNGSAMPLSSLPIFDGAEFTQAVSTALGLGGRLAAILPIPKGDEIDLIALIARDSNKSLSLLKGRLSKPFRLNSLTRQFPQVQAFERELLEDCGIVFEGHPWSKPLRKGASHDLEGSEGEAPGYAYFSSGGEGVHEVAVGPVHAGVIEPGHFRFQCRGESVFHLEIRLGYQRRGARELMPGASPARRLVVAESIAGDTAVGHGWAHCAVVEALSEIKVAAEAEILRAVALELERAANHVGDLGALCGDVGYLPGASWFGRLRGDFLNLLMEFSGNRFGRGLVVPGGARFGLSQTEKNNWRERLGRARRDFLAVSQLAFDSPSVLARFETTGRVSRETAWEIGMVGPAARACGVDMDARRDHPIGYFCKARPAVCMADTGDVLARAAVRRDETVASIDFILERLKQIPEETSLPKVGKALPNCAAAAIVEGWRGEIVHISATDEEGKLIRYQAVDPSFHNWFGLALAVRGNGISDFPLCNKSFNLSYAGHDL